MVAGATGIDLFLMVVAADDGVMPQTREHAAVLAALGVDRGRRGDDEDRPGRPGPGERRGRAVCRARESLTPVVVPVSVRTGEGLDALRAALDDVAATLPGRGADGGGARLHVDRVFTIRGAGTVVTGTLWSGAIARGDEVTVLPAGRRARVRGVQVHDEPVERAPAGQRVAVNLVGVGRDEVARGDVLASADADLRPTFRLDAALRFVSDRRPEHGDRVQVHHGTRETPARLAELGGRFCQLRLEQPLVPVAGRPPRAPLARAAGHARRRRRARPGAQAPRPFARSTARLERLSAASRSRAAAAGAQAPDARRPTPDAPVRRQPSPSRSRLEAAGLEPPLEAELGDAAAELPALRAAGRAVRLGRRCTSTPSRWPRSSAACARASTATARSPSPSCATSSAPHASTRRRCSSTSTPRGSRCADRTTAACCDVA